MDGQLAVVATPAAMAAADDDDGRPAGGWALPQVLLSPGEHTAGDRHLPMRDETASRLRAAGRQLLTSCRLQARSRRWPTRATPPGRAFLHKAYSTRGRGRCPRCDCAPPHRR